MAEFDSQCIQSRCDDINRRLAIIVTRQRLGSPLIVVIASGD